MSTYLTPLQTKIPDGKYSGEVSGYELKFLHAGKVVMAHLSFGVRGINIPCSFAIRDGKVCDVEMTGNSKIESGL